MLLQPFTKACIPSLLILPTLIMPQTAPDCQPTRDGQQSPDLRGS
jgi:hypothetical protein